MSPTTDFRKKELAQKIFLKRHELSEWTLKQARSAPPPFYSSVDLRDSGHKIVPVDSNLFPAGFNNICPEDLRTAPELMRALVDSQASQWKLKEAAKKVVILPEAHTANLYYWENVYYLSQILREAGLEVRVSWYGDWPASSSAKHTLKTQTDKEVVVERFEIQGQRLKLLDGFDPDFILLNNDFSSGYPALLDDLSQPLLPSHRLGWHSRKKSDHFLHYNELAREFAAIIGEDAWTFTIDTEVVEPVNFNESQGIEETAQSVERILGRTRDGYASHGVKYDPFVFVKNNAGTYGMGIMVVHSADEIRSINRRTKNKMSVGKNRLAIGSLAIQEGIPTTTLIDRLAAEPVIYLLGSELLGGFLRTNTEKGIEDNLNSSGMVFRKLCMTDLREGERESDDPEGDGRSDGSHLPTLELIYGSVARLSALAAGRELAVLSRPLK